ncbi:P-II family nitrogen regulator [Nitrincola sp.]|uniref:P-II family nitrogen regulator n=1 Tax=Nitrincola sp. TaxID=1926584 RepID=UPI003A923B33
MKFSVLTAIVSEDYEQKVIDGSRELGAGGITLLSGRGIGSDAKKTFFGMTYEGSQSIIIMVLEKGLSLEILKSIQTIIVDKENNNSHGVVFTLPLEHLGGIDLSQLAKFEQHLKENL